MSIKWKKDIHVIFGRHLNEEGDINCFQNETKESILKNDTFVNILYFL